MCIRDSGPEASGDADGAQAAPGDASGGVTGYTLGGIPVLKPGESLEDHGISDPAIEEGKQQAREQGLAL